jgi:hypothetical protein
MGSMAKQLAKKQKRKEIKSLKKVFLDERKLHERLLSEGLMESSNLVGHSVRKIDWEAQLKEMKKDTAAKIVKKVEEVIDLSWDDESAPDLTIDTSALTGVK